jgi:hypothetical protein
LGIGILLLFLHVKPGRYQRLDLFDENGKGELFLEDQITG